jgi:hypothetical protein
MLGMHLPITLFIPGTLSANHTFSLKMPVNGQLVSVSAVQSSAAGTGAGSIKIGKPGDDDAYLEAYTIGVSGTPKVADRGDFDGADVTGTYPRLLKDDTLLVTVTNGATASANVGVVLTFAEG